jgi:hypothetical protein
LLLRGGCCRDVDIHFLERVSHDSHERFKPLAVHRHLQAHAHACGRSSQHACGRWRHITRSSIGGRCAWLPARCSPWGSHGTLPPAQAASSMAHVTTALLRGRMHARTHQRACHPGPTCGVAEEQHCSQACVVRLQPHVPPCPLSLSQQQLHRGARQQHGRVCACMHMAPCVRGRVQPLLQVLPGHQLPRCRCLHHLGGHGCFERLQPHLEGTTQPAVHASAVAAERLPHGVRVG